MANKRVFISFAIEDETTKILFTGQAKNKNVPYDIVDMSAKQPWDEKWKTNCRSRIIGCDGAIALVSKNTKNASGQLWEIECTIEEHVPLMGIYVDEATSIDKPSNLLGVICKEWTWDNVKSFIDSL